MSNAGGEIPLACAEALRAEIARQGLALKEAAAIGDDLLKRVNAYLGAFPIAAALNDGADIVITGRCVDSAVSLGACIHRFGWSPQDHEQLSGDSLAGHILECGPQANGGNFTDWALVADGYARIGYPIAEVSPDGRFVVSKPEGSGGLVSLGTVAEQMVYEIGDPQAYLLPDVHCDFSEVCLTPTGTDQVRVTDAKGCAPPPPTKPASHGATAAAVATCSAFTASMPS